MVSGDNDCDRGSNCWLVDTDIPAEAAKGLAKAKKAAKDTALIIDFGSWQCRAGFACEAMPSMVFDQTVHRIADKEGAVSFSVGRHCPVGSNKSSSRSAFESGLVVHFTSVERTLDFIFDSLKITEDSINFPIIITEPFENPPYIRDEFLELLLKGYRVPRVLFTDDITPCLLHNQPDCASALVLSLGNYFTSVCLFIDGRIQTLKRINFGGSQAADLLLRLIQCKYPSFPIKMSLSQATCLFWKASVVAKDYLAVLSEMGQSEGIQRHDFIAQFPYPKVDEQLEKEREEQAAVLLKKRREMAERLRERAASKRSEKLKSKEDHFRALHDLLERIKENSGKRRSSNNNLAISDDDDLSVTSEDAIDDEHYEELKIHGFEQLSDLEESVVEAEKDLKRYKNRLLGIEEEKEEPKYDLLDVPDSQLNEIQIREKRRQRLLKASADAREKARLEKEQASRLEEEMEHKDAEWRATDFESWKRHYYLERSVLAKRIIDRQKQREALADRRSQAASARLKNVMSLVDQDSSEDSSHAKSKRKKPKKTPALSKKGAKEKKDKDQIDMEIIEESYDNLQENEDDGFGAKDSDWHIYRQIKRDELSDEEEDERDHERLAAVEGKLEQYDTGFYDVIAEEMSRKATIMDLLKSGGDAKATEEASDAAAYQLHINVERYRVPEVLFQPPIAGIDQAGIIEIICDLIKTVDESTRASLLANVFLCGSMCQIAGLEERLLHDLTRNFSTGSVIHITKQSSNLDAWKGCASLKTAPWITKKEFENK